MIMLGKICLKEDIKTLYRMIDELDLLERITKLNKSHTLHLQIDNEDLSNLDKIITHSAMLKDLAIKIVEKVKHDKGEF